MDAAAACFCSHGFHSTSMAEIAKTAGLSVGQIYRYFTGKDAIIEAIVESDLDRHSRFISELEQAHPDRVMALLIERVDDGFCQLNDPNRAALTAEVAAEAVRNPKVAALLRQAEQRALGMLRGLLARSAPPEWSASDLDARAEMLALLFDGLALRLIKNPQLDQAGLMRAMRVAIRSLLAA